MKIIPFNEDENGASGKIGLPHVVNKANKTVAKPITEVFMNINMIATLTAFGLGIAVFLAHRINNRMARQPILIENRRILYKRERQ